MRVKVEDYNLNVSHMEALQIIVGQKGECRGVDCRNCPFERDNNSRRLSCVEISDHERHIDEDTLELAVEMVDKIDRIFASSDEVYKDTEENYEIKFVSVTFDPERKESYYNFNVVGSSRFVIYRISDFENLKGSRFIKL